MGAGAPAEPVRVGVVGLGRSGYGIHLKTLARNPAMYRIVAVADGDEGRRQETAAEFGCQSHATPEALFADADVELAVIATPNFLHAPLTVAALRAGKHAVCEKPFGLTVADADAMIAAAAEATRAAGRPIQVAPFHNLRFDDSFQAVRRIVTSGRLGEILELRIALHSFSRRWDWQTLRAYGGGQLYNNGSHMLDLAMDLLEACAGIAEGDALEVFADMRRALGSGDTEDHVFLALRYRDRPDAPLVHIEVSTACAYPQERYFVMGTLGGLHGTTRQIEWKWLEPSELPERSVQEAPTADRSYNREELSWHAEMQECDDTPSRSHDRYYASLFETLRRGEPLAVTPQSLRRRIAVIERALALSDSGGGPEKR